MNHQELIERLRAQDGMSTRNKLIADATDAIESLLAENERLKSLATTKGAMGLLADQLKQLAAAQEEIQKLRQDLLISYGESEELSGQLAKAEQRVAAACAKWIDRYAGIHQKEMLSDTAKSFADALRRGEWRKFVKEM